MPLHFLSGQPWLCLVESWKPPETEVFLHLVCITLSVNKFFLLSNLNLPKLVTCVLLSLFYQLQLLRVADYLRLGGASEDDPVTWCDLLQPGPTTRLYSVSQGLNQLSFEHLQGWRLQHISGKAQKQDFPHSHGERRIFPLCPAGIFCAATLIPCHLSPCCVPPGVVWLCLLSNITAGSRRLQLNLLLDDFPGRTSLAPSASPHVPAIQSS